MLEIIINNYYVSNSTERDAVVKDLLQYIFQEDKNTLIVSKLGRATFSEFTGVDMIPMPSEKLLLNANFVEYIEGLVGNIEKCSKLDKQGNIYNITLNVNTMTVNNAETINNIENAACEESSNNIYEYIQYIRTEKPSWYKEDEWIKKDILYEHYIDLYETINKQKFAVLFKGKLYKLENRKMVNKIRQNFVKLLKISDL
jgi:hypothetical protein